MSYAITASPQPALADRSWDDQIVPALRKRLESESRAISKRMSAASFGSGDEIVQSAAARPPTGSNRRGGRTTPSSTSTERPSAIPRPSLNYSRPSNEGSYELAAGAGARRARPNRKRTLSQPFVLETEELAGDDDLHESNGSATNQTNGLPTPASSRSNSPAIPYAFSTDARPTRIPKAPIAKGASSTRPDGPITSTPKRHVQEPWNNYRHFASSGSSVELAATRPAVQNVIMQENPPFTANSSYVSEVEYDLDRPSAEEERPFEHWYRGDLSRNGGVGELRVVNRVEMLEIANYGHKIKQLANGSVARRRRRAGSIGNRDSALLEDSEVDRRPMVLDETPLTDMEADTELETDREISYAREFRRQAEQVSVPDTLVPRQTRPGTNASASSSKNRLESHIPRAAPTPSKRTVSAPLQTVTASSSSASSDPTRVKPPGSIIPHSHSVATSTPKRGRTKSPPTATPVKKPKPTVTSPQKRSKSTAGIRSIPREVVQYPEVPDVPGGMADAIPSWTQPKKAGNWDDVVLPVVARKLGLEDQIEEANGNSPPPRRASQDIIPPQPGTFGIDPNKRRHRYDPATGEPISPDRTARSGDEDMSGDVDGTKTSNETAVQQNASPIMNGAIQTKSQKRYSRPASPPPFAHYQRPTTEVKLDRIEPLQIEEEDSSGCCKCIIM